MADEKNKKGKKQIIAVSGLSTGTYRGTTIYETPTGFAVALGMLVYYSQFLNSIKGFIDQWYEAKKN